MSLQASDPAVASDPPASRFDISVRMDRGVTADRVRQRALDELRMDPDKVERLVEALRMRPAVRIGSGVSREKAEALRAEFGRIGLLVDLAPVLTIQGLQSDLQVTCPACQHRFVIDAARQCPACGAFVDKWRKEPLASDERLQQARRRAAEEAAVRERIRRGLAAEAGGRRGTGGLSGPAGKALLAVGVVGLVAAAFAGGQWRAGTEAAAALAAQMAQAERAARPAQDVDRMLARVGDGGEGAAPPSEAAAPSGEDSLLAGLGAGARSGGRAGPADGGPGARGAQAPAAAAATGPSAAASGAGPAVPGVDAASSVSPTHRLTLMLALARTLAETGQLARAREVSRAVQLAPAAVAGDWAAAARQLDLEIAAWALGQVAADQHRARVEALRQQAQALPAPAERVAALARAGAILARHPAIPAEAARAFLTLAREALPTVSDAGARAEASAVFLDALGQTLLHDVRHHAVRGEWARARATAGDMAALLAQAPSNDSLLRLTAIDLQVRQMLGGTEAAVARLGEAAVRIAKEASVATQAAQLRALATVPGLARDARFVTLVDRATAVAEGKQGASRSEALAQIALLWADQGAEDRFEDVRRRALDTQGLTPAERADLAADLLVLGELSAVRRLRAAQSPADAEARLRKAAAVLL